jgi:hypothetical protein
MNRGWANRGFRGGPLTADFADGRGSELWLHPWFMAPWRANSLGVEAPHGLKKMKIL